MHHPFGMSSYWRRANCPGSYHEESGLSDIPRPEAQEGTDYHAEVAQAIMAWKQGIDPWPAEGDELVEGALEFFRRLVEELDPRPREVLVEHRCELYSGGELLTWGTCDLAIVNEHRLRIAVVDWKFGRIALLPADVLQQVVLYAEALLGGLPRRGEWVVEGFVVNPRLKRVDRVELDPTFDWTEVLEKVINTAKKSRHLNPGEWCRYCRALGLCEATQGETRQVAKLGEAPPKELAAKLAEYPPERIEAMLDVLPRVEAAVKAVKARAKELLASDPHALPSRRLAQRRGRRALDIASAMQATDGVLTREQLLACCNVQVPALERAFVATYEDAKEGKAAWRNLVAPHITQPTFEELRRYEPPNTGSPGP